MLPQVGPEGQVRLGEAKVLVAGVGGLGCISSSYLAAAGLGHVLLVDRDRVEVGNLNRQILYTTEEIGTPKALAAARRLSAQNPDCTIEGLEAELREDTLTDMARGCSLIVDGSDTWETRRVLNRASLEWGIPLIFGGINGFEGMVSTFVPGQGPCFACLFPGPPPGGGPPGVLGPLPGIVGSLQALEALKILLHLPGTLVGRLLKIRGASLTFSTVSVLKNPHCPACRAWGEPEDTPHDRGRHTHAEHSSQWIS